MSKTYTLAILAVLLVAGVFVYWRNPKDSSSITNEIYETVNPSVTSTPTTIISARKKILEESLTYSEAVKKYVDRRIQFDVHCQATPVNPVYKNGTSIMFDNRSGDARWVALDDRAYYLGGYGFKVLTLASQTLPHEISVDCGAAKNVIRILLQK